MIEFVTLLPQAEAKKRKEPEKAAMPTPILGPKPPTAAGANPTAARQQGESYKVA